jgi:hypothetical protein
MAKAAQHLGVSPPAVSEVIAGLEHTLGVPLLDRDGRAAMWLRRARPTGIFPVRFSIGVCAVALSAMQIDSRLLFLC